MEQCGNLDATVHGACAFSRERIRAGISRRTKTGCGNRNIAPFAERQFRGDEGSRLLGGLDHQGELGDSCEDAIPFRKTISIKAHARRIFRNQTAACIEYRRGERRIRRRIHPIESAGEYGDRGRRPALQSAAVRRRIDPARQPRHHAEARIRRLFREMPPRRGARASLASWSPPPSPAASRGSGHRRAQRGQTVLCESPVKAEDTPSPSHR